MSRATHSPALGPRPLEDPAGLRNVETGILSASAIWRSSTSRSSAGFALPSRSNPPASAMISSKPIRQPSQNARDVQHAPFAKRVARPFTLSQQVQPAVMIPPSARRLTNDASAAAKQRNWLTIIRVSSRPSYGRAEMYFGNTIFGFVLPALGRSPKRDQRSQADERHGAEDPAPGIHPAQKFIGRPPRQRYIGPERQPGGEFSPVLCQPSG